jgi:lysine-specific demethylase 3
MSLCRYVNPIRSCNTSLLSAALTGCRTIQARSNTGSPVVSFSYSASSIQPLFPTVFSRELSPFLITIKKRACARALLPVLLKERVHIRRPNAIFRYREVDVRVTCDMCATSLFSQSWLCSKCGREICHDCFNGLVTPNSPGTKCSEQSGLPHFQSDFIPISRFRTDELSEAIDEMQVLVDHDTQDHSRDNELDGIIESMDAIVLTEQETSSDRVYSDLEVPRFHTSHFSDAEFLRHWSQGIPAIIGPIHFQGHWDPQYFIKVFGLESVTLEDCETGNIILSTVAEFFMSFLAPGQRETI